MDVTVLSAFPAHGIALRGEGKPPTQGSVTPMHAPGGRRIYLKPSDASLRDFRAAVKRAVNELEAWEPIPAGVAVQLRVRIYLPRPKAHYRTGRFAHERRDHAPALPTKKPDGDKVLRAVNDALTLAGVWHDDAQVFDQRVTKLWADDRPPGVEVDVTTR